MPRRNRDARTRRAKRDRTTTSVSIPTTPTTTDELARDLVARGLRGRTILGWFDDRQPHREDTR